MQFGQESALHCWREPFLVAEKNLVQNEQGGVGARGAQKRQLAKVGQGPRSQPEPWKEAAQREQKDGQDGQIQGRFWAEIRVHAGHAVAEFDEAREHDARVRADDRFRRVHGAWSALIVAVRRKGVEIPAAHKEKK